MMFLKLKTLASFTEFTRDSNVNDSTFVSKNLPLLIFMTHGSVIFISPLKSIGCNDLMTDFGKPRSNDFNRLEGKWANRRL
jgi:hypothetical protein